MMNQQELEKLRKKLERIDDEILALLDQRMIVAAEVGGVKDVLGLPLNDAPQEKAIFRRLQKKAEHPLLGDFVEPIFSSVFECAKAERAFSKKSEIPMRNIGILGLGLIGGSILRALKAREGSLLLSIVESVDVDSHMAGESGLVDRTFRSLEKMVNNVECLVLAVPIPEVLPLAAEIGALVKNRKKPLLVLDVASVKGEISSAFENLSNDHVEFVATHPIAGKETSGFASGEAALFVNVPWVITPHARNSDAAIHAIEALVEYIGARSKKLDAATHDKYMAVLSHVPGILAKSYQVFVQDLLPNGEELAGPGFRSFTRLAHSNPRMRKEIAKENKKEIDFALSQWIDTIRRPHD